MFGNYTISLLIIIPVIIMLICTTIILLIEAFEFTQSILVTHKESIKLRYSGFLSESTSLNNTWEYQYSNTRVKPNIFLDRINIALYYLELYRDRLNE